METDSPAPPATAPPSPAFTRRRSLVARSLSGVVATALLVVAVWGLGSAATSYSGTRSDAIETVADPRGFRFLALDRSSGEPVRYNPCEGIRYVINQAGAPPGAVDDVHAAFSETARVSGLDFKFEGLTDEVPEPHRPLVQPDRYGRRWVPILVGWRAGGITPDKQHAAGTGGSTYVPNRVGRLVFVTGMMTFNSESALSPGFGTASWGKVALHELGHVLGLDHVDNPAQVMNPTLGLSTAMWGAGDATGLGKLGRAGGCIETPEPFSS